MCLVSLVAQQVSDPLMDPSSIALSANKCRQSPVEPLLSKQSSLSS